MLKLFLTFIVALMFTGLSSCAKQSDSLLYGGETADQIFLAGKDNLRRGSWPDAIKRFNTLAVKYPLYARNDLALIYLMYAYYKQEDFRAAEVTATRVINIYPIGKYTDYAYFIRGLAKYYRNQGVLDRIAKIHLEQRDLVDYKEAFRDFTAVVNNFAHSVYAPAAYQYSVYLRNLLANHQLQIAQFYYQRMAYVAALNRASIVIKYYSGSSAVPLAVNLMAKCYDKLGMHDKYQLLSRTSLEKPEKKVDNLPTI